jgi:hypothetical protein
LLLLTASPNGPKPVLPGSIVAKVVSEKPSAMPAAVSARVALAGLGAVSPMKRAAAAAAIELDSKNVRIGFLLVPQQNREQQACQRRISFKFN